MKFLTELALLMLWVTGMVIAKGFWSTFFAIVLPPWGWYLVMEQLLIARNIL